MLKVMRRGLRAHLFRLALTALVVLMGVGFVSGSQLLSDTVARGFSEVFSARYEGTDVVVRSSDSVFTFGGQQRAPVDEALLAEVRATEGVRAAEGNIQAPVRLLGKDGRSTGATGVGLALQTFGLNWPTDEQINRWRITDGRQPTGEHEVVIDQKAAVEHGFTIGDRLEIPFAQGTIPFTIVGIARFQTNPNFSGSTAVLFDTPTAQRYLVGENRFNWIAVAAQPGESPAVLRSTLQSKSFGSGNIQVLTGEQFVKEDQDLYQRLINGVSGMLVVFGCVALFVSSFVIYNTFSLIIAQRTRELALLRALGAARAQVVLGVLVEALAVGVLAATFGLGAGLVFATGVSRLLDSLGFLPTNSELVIEPRSFIPAFVIGVVATLTAGLFPAIKASRIPPVAAMREHLVEPRAYSRWRVAVGTLTTAVGAGLLWLGLARTSMTFVGVGMGFVFLGVAVLGPVFVSPLSTVLGSPAAARGVTGVLARENASRNPKRTAATTSAVMVGVALVTFIAIIGESVRVATAEAVDLAVVGDLVVNTPTVGFSGVSPELTAKLNARPEVAAAASFRIGIALADGRPSLFFGVDPSKLQQVVKFDVTAGSLDDLGIDGIAVSKRLADDHHLSVGSPILVHFQSAGIAEDGDGANSTASTAPTTSASPTQSTASSTPTNVTSPTTSATAGTAPRPSRPGAPRSRPPAQSANDRVLTVRAVFDSELLRGSAGYLITQGLFEQVFSAVEQSDFQSYIKLAPGVDPSEARQRLQAVVAAYPPAELQDLTEFKRAQSAPIDRFVTFIWALLLMAVLISAIGILNTLMLSVYERTRELGMLRVAGMSRQQVRSAVRWEALIISIMGTLLGLVIGVSFGWAVVRTAAEEGLRTFAVPGVQLAIIVLLAGLIGIVAAILPARRAANLDVLDAIATE